MSGAASATNGFGFILAQCLAVKCGRRRFRCLRVCFFVELGEVRIRAEGAEIVVPRGQAFFSTPGLRQHWFAKNTRLLSVGFRCQWTNGSPLFRRGLLICKASLK